MNTAGKLLVVLGPLLIVAGVITAFVGAANAESDRYVDEFVDAAMGWSSSDEIYAGQVWMWVGIATACLGALIVVGLLLVLAARPKTHGPN